MSRYIITRDTIKGQEYLISALYSDKGKMLEVLPERVGGASILGNIYIARVENIVKNLNAAFVRIGPDVNCYLPLEDCRCPIFTKKCSVNKAIAAGDELLVQVSREALKTKEAAVTANLNLTGRFVVLTTGNRRIGISTKLKKEQRERFQKLLKESMRAGTASYADMEELWEEDGGKSADLEKISKKAAASEDLSEIDYGVIIRTNAQNAADEEVLAELKVLSRRLWALKETAVHKTWGQCVFREEAGYYKQLRNLRQAELTEITTDDRNVFQEICGFYGIPEEALMTGGSVSVPVTEVKAGEHICIRHYTDEMVSLSALYGFKTKLEEALRKKVWLKSGAYLVIEYTEALTVVDVNTGKNIAKKNVQENFKNVNLEAAAEIAHQIRLRNLSGIILIDFINLTNPEAVEELLAAFRRELKKDPIPAQLIDMTKLGLVEVTRKKVKKPLHELMEAPPSLTLSP